MTAARTPANAGALYFLTQSAAGTYLAPVQASDKAVAGLISQPHPVQTGKVEQTEETTPFGGGGYAVTDALRWDWPVTVRARGLGVTGGTTPVGDFLPLLRACALTEDAPVVSDGIAVRFRPVVNYTIAGSAPQTGNPKVASATWIDGGDGNPLVYRGRDIVGRLASISTENGAIHLGLECHALWYRDSDDIDSSRVPRSSTSFTIADVAYLSRADHPYFNSNGWTLTINGGSDSAAELAAAACIESIQFDSGMSLEEQLCHQETDGYDPSWSYQAGPCALTLALTQMAGTTLTSPFSAMIRDLVGTSITLRKTLTAGGVTWAIQLKINNFEVFGVESGDSTGKRIETVTFRGHTLSTTSLAWELQFERVEP